jgi:hypothetical protein
MALGLDLRFTCHMWRASRDASYLKLSRFDRNCLNHTVPTEAREDGTREAPN